MQKIAAEFNYSEVTFVLPPEDPAQLRPVSASSPRRWKCPSPAIRTSAPPMCSASRRRSSASRSAIRCVSRKRPGSSRSSSETQRRPGRSAPRSARRSRCTSAPRSPRKPSPAASRIDLARILNYHPCPGLRLRRPELRRRRTGRAGGARPQPSPNLAAFPGRRRRQRRSSHDFSLFVYVRSPDNPWNIRARMFAPLDNVPEDPATGSASAALAAYLVSLAPEAIINRPHHHRAGRRNGSPQHHRARCCKAGRHRHRCRPSPGRCVPVMRGEIAC